jgi:hypothetical protein
MRTFFKLALLLTATCTIFGCAHNYYNVPQETVEKKVRTIGVAPILVDPESDIRHPDKSAIVSLVQGYNAKSEKELIARLRSTGIFYSVRQVDGEPTRLFSSLVSSRERRDDAGVIYNKYFYKREEVKQLISENGLDALMIVTVSGLTRPEKIYSSNLLSYLETDYNYLSMTAQLLDRDGTLIWEYPNFRRSSLSYPMFFRLQYPDFDEAAANLSDKVDVKFKTVAGITAAFAQSEASAVANGPAVSTLYSKQFEEMLTLLKPYKPLFGDKKDKPAAPGEPAAPAPIAAPTTYNAPAVTPPAAVTSPAATPAPQTTAPAPVAAPRPNVPPAGFTSGDIVPEEPPAK